MAIHCFYHSADLDGHCSGAIVKYKYPEAIMHPINYGQEFPWDEIKTEDTVYMVDFCLQPWAEMERLANILKRGNLIWVDHHSSAIKEWQSRPYPEPWIKTALRTDMAACEIAWIGFFPGISVPLAVKLLSLYDSWTYLGHELEDMVLPFQMRMRMEQLDPQFSGSNSDWYTYFHMGEDEIEDLVEEGELILRYDEEQKRKYVQMYGFETYLPAHTLGIPGQRYNPNDYNEIDVRDYINFLESLLSECKRTMAEHSWGILWHAAEWREIIFNMLTKKYGFWSTLLTGKWIKPTGQCKRPEKTLANACEEFFYFSKGEPVIVRQGHTNTFLYTGVAAQKKIHPTERPIELIEDILSTFCWEGARIMVPCLGSGKTLLAAEKLGMSAFGFDISKGYKDAFILQAQELFGN